MPVKKLSFVTLLCVACLLILPNVAAKTVNGLYSGELKVESQSLTARRQAAVKLFKLVLIKVSGRSDVVEQAAISGQLKDAMRYITTFNYVVRQGNTFLSASFNESLIDNLLKQAGISIWGNQRPTAMIWLAIQDASEQRIIVADDVNAPFSQVVTQAIKARGVPMLLPLWDLEDQFSVSGSEIWGLFHDSVGGANLRYGSDFMVLGKVKYIGLNYQLNWAIYKKTGLYGYEEIVATGLDEFADSDRALKGLVDQTSDFFASQYSVDTSDEGGYEFVVNNVNSIGVYAKILDYLTGLKSVESVQLVKSKGSIFTFQAKIIGSTNSLSEVLKLEQKLVKTYDDEQGKTQYNWQAKR